MYIGLVWWPSWPCCFLPALFRFDLEPPPGFEPPPPGGFECEDPPAAATGVPDGGTAGAWGRLGMVVVNPEAPEPGEAVDGVAGPEIKRVIQKSKIISKKIARLIFWKSFNKIEK